MAFSALLLLPVIGIEGGAQPHRAAPTRAATIRVAPGDFPHAKHARLFPTCEGCHADVTGASTTELFPTVASCNTCHNNVDAKPITWAPPRRPAPQGLLAFSHRTHFAEADSATRQCTACHAAPQGSGFMDVAAARSPTCFSCHEHRAASHYAADNRCATCHVALARAPALSAAQVRALPKPPSHDAEGFVSAHAPTAATQPQCATCHARESCARCHVNSATLPAITALAADARMAEVVRDMAPSYPVPETHRREAFPESHGAVASASGATCANCHARSSCTACHTGPGASAVLRALPEPTRGPRGVQLRRSRRDASERLVARGVTIPRVSDTTVHTVRPHAGNYAEAHRTTASSGQLNCEGCHTRRFCVDCHAGETRRGFHPPNFVARHGAPTYARDRDCASCHNTEVFCRACHQAAGLQAAGRNAAVYHNAQPQWLLQHGRAARLELSSCTTCHTQATCLRCHATTGWGVNPHGSDFDATRLGRKAMAMCARCHITDPRRSR